MLSSTRHGMPSMTEAVKALEGQRELSASQVREVGAVLGLTAAEVSQFFALCGASGNDVARTFSAGSMRAFVQALRLDSRRVN